MKLKWYFLVGSVVGLVMPALLIAIAVGSGYVFESPTVALALPGFLPFGSSDPEDEMSC
jgi:hypothetical protein